MESQTLDAIVFILVIVGALSWGLVGVFDFNAVEYVNRLTGLPLTYSRIVYAAFGLAAIWTAYTHKNLLSIN